MATVTIDGNTFDVYADIATADAYLAGSVTATAWRAADEDTKARALVSATRWLDELNWLGKKADPGQPLDWPRTGVPDVDSSTIPQGVIDACIELAAQLVADPDLRTTITQTATKRLKAGPVELEYFRGRSVETTTPLPTSIMGLITAYLGGSAGGAAGIGGARSFGTGRQDAFRDDYDLNEGL